MKSNIGNIDKAAPIRVCLTYLKKKYQVLNVQNI